MQYYRKHPIVPVLLLAIAGLINLAIAEAEAKTSTLFCGSPAHCTAYPYRPQGGYGAVESICAKNKPCFVSPDCNGEEFCAHLEPPRAR
jgi:hypothetical protein